MNGHKIPIIVTTIMMKWKSIKELVKGTHYDTHTRPTHTPKPILKTLMVYNWPIRNVPRWLYPNYDIDNPELNNWIINLNPIKKGYSSPNANICMVAKYGASKQKLWSNLMFDGEKQPGSSGSCLTLQLFITDFHKMEKCIFSIISSHILTIAGRAQWKRT